jgi:hypothetical protein
VTATLEFATAPRTWGTKEPWHDIVVPIRYRKRSTGGYYVHRADNDHSLGWVFKNRDGTWTGYVANTAFHPAGADIMVTSKKHPSFPGEDWFKGYEVGTRSESRADAALNIVWALDRHRAEAIEDLIEAARAAWLAEKEG